MFLREEVLPVKMAASKAIESLFSICMTIPLSAVIRWTRTSDTSNSSVVLAILMQGSQTQHSTANSDSHACMPLPFRFAVLLDFSKITKYPSCKSSTEDILKNLGKAGLPCSATLEKKSEVATNQEVVSVIPDERGAAWYWWRRCRGRPRPDDDDDDMAVNEAVDTRRMWGSILNSHWKDFHSG